MRRRDFIAGLGAAVWPPFARAQERVRRVGVLMNVASDDPEGQLCLAAFQQDLQALGWTVGRNLMIEHRWSVEVERYREAAIELVSLAPDVLLIAGAGVGIAQQASQTIPIVFPQAIDPVGSGFVKRLSRPGGNATGFMQFEFSLAGKWLEYLREVAPGATRIGMFREARNPAGIGQWAALQVAAEPTGLELLTLSFRSAGEIERDIAAFAREPNGALIVAVGVGGAFNRRTIIENVARHNLAAIYPHRYMASEGGLMAYGIDLVEQYRRAAGYIDRILRGEKPGDLPVQKPTKYQLTVNLKTAKALHLMVPPTLLARADEVIE